MAPHVEAHEQAVKRGPSVDLVDAGEIVQEHFDGAADQRNMLETNESAELNSSNCLVVVVGDGEAADDKAVVTNLPAESTESTDMSTSLAISSNPPVICPLQVVGVEDQEEPLLAPCLPPPVTYSRTVHTPVIVSAEEFARALSGAAAVDSMVVTANIAANESAQHMQSTEKAHDAPPQPKEQVKIQKKERVAAEPAKKPAVQTAAAVTVAAAVAAHDAPPQPKEQVKIQKKERVAAEPAKKPAVQTAAAVTVAAAVAAARAVAARHACLRIPTRGPVLASFVLVAW
eukprot:CAMPEP_0172778346 /NCGR_PEP_ID=MMETSP1074-20121228/201861_1 /TAXON_ID=2916 /ORGANISM="Ceratium fusus, Strain PA161109" /LENGTH=286 /DNA_ID=CAMNT_0013615277 /DNA_START=29 /DNA_END=888 /DNA_ORIENTATION=-